ncbi:RND transporter [Saccharopolyspora subtropica]|uniref:MMPL family transporter n=1 Tax=Saccharopolyspora thermophila TaxID=89367 RepID=A0A917JUV8_9PSEU|nr:efflux RND transporter permease subunit [Saccharopolyspora subtropica]GGI87375.1 RND transporter [Saccharopolyspora subtropica]
MSSFLHSLGRRAFAARKTVLALWLLVLAVGGGAAGLLNKGMDNTVTIPGTEAQEALDRLSVTFPQTSGASAQLVVVVPGGVRDPGVRREVERAVGELDGIEQVAQTVSPYATDIGGQISDDGRAGLITIQLDGVATAIDQATKDRIAAIAHGLQQRLPAGSQVSHGGPLFAQNFPGLSIVEALGLVIAVVVLVITLGSFLAAGMPLVNALIGVGISMALIFVATALGPITATTPLLALMLGLAVGIDYALFIVSRHQQELAAGSPPREAAARAVATAGSAVIFAGLTVIIALVGLGVAGIPFLTTMGVAAAVAVGIAVLVSITLVPALLGFAGNRLQPRQRARRSRREPVGTRFFTGWVRAVTRFPAVTVLAVVAVLGLATVPAAGLRLALPDAGALPEDDPARVTYDLVSEHFSPGFNGPLIVTATIVTSTDPLGLMDDLKREIERLPGVAEVPLATPNPTADTGIVQVIPEGAPDSAETKQLVAEIRALHGHFHDTYGIDISVTGFTAVGIDVSDKLGAALLPFGVVVVGLSLLLLTMVFRSVAVPVKATLGYLLSIGASLGLVTLVFQDGWLADALNVERTGPVISFMPIVLMGVLFGLAMDYEVFLVSRMREEYVHTRDARAAVTTGFVSSARVVTAAAVIMFAVFVAFVPEGDANLKPIAFGLAVGVFVDAFVVRMTLVPAVLVLLGERAWWMPRKLDRALPSFDIEGESLREELALADWPRPGSDEAVACEGLWLADPDTGRPVYRDVGFLLPRQGVHVVRGADETAVSALLLTLSGRLQPDRGKLKVLGHALPARAAAVRSRVAYVDAGDGGVEPVRRALGERPAVLVLDRTDRVSDPGARREIRDLLAGAGCTAIAGTTGLADLRDILPAAEAATTTDLRDDAVAPARVLSGAVGQRLS